MSYCVVRPVAAWGADMCFDEVDVGTDLAAADFGGSETLRETGVPGSSLITVGAVALGRTFALDKARFARKRGSSELSLKNSRRSWSFPGLSPSRNPWA